MIQIYPVIVKHVNIAEKVLVRILELKRKVNKKKSTKSKNDYIETPKEFKEKHKQITLCMDIIFINRMPMLITIDKTIRYRALVHSIADMLRSYIKVWMWLWENIIEMIMK